MAKVLTALSIQNAKAKRRNGVSVLTEISDGGCSGLRLVVHPSGHRSWIVRYRYGGRSRKLTLGNAIVMPPGEKDPGNGALTLALARKACTDALHRLAQGFDPGVEKLETQQHSSNQVETFKSVAEGCFKREDNRLRSAGRSLQNLQRLAFPVLGSRPIAAIRRSDIVRLLDSIDAEKGPTMADAILASISKVMRDHSRRSDDFVGPIVPGMRRTSNKERARSRVLDDDELRRVWAASSDGIFGKFVRFLLLTACRRNEAALLVWSELAGNGVTWVLPKERNKTKQELIRPLSKAAQDILAGLPRTGNADLVFQGDGRKVIANFDPMKRAFDKQCGVTGWTLHDLRRTARTLLSRAGVQDQHAERCLGHVIGGVKGVYDRHKYEAEMLAAYERLSTLIGSIVNPRENVIPLHA